MQEAPAADTIKPQEVKGNGGQSEGSREDKLPRTGAEETGIREAEKNHGEKHEGAEPSVRQAFERARRKYKQDGVVKDIWLSSGDSIQNETQKEQASKTAELLGIKNISFFRGEDSDNLSGISNEAGIFINADDLDSNKDEASFLITHEWAHTTESIRDGVKRIISDLSETEIIDYLDARFGKANDQTPVWKLNARYNMEQDKDWLFNEIVSDASGAYVYLRITGNEYPFELGISDRIFDATKNALITHLGGTQNVETEISADKGSAIQPSVSGQAGRGLVEGVLQAELSESGGKGPGSGVQVLRQAGYKSTGRAVRDDAAGRSGGRSAGDREGVSVPEGRGEHEVGAKEEIALTENPKGNNFLIGDSLNLPSGEKARYKANIDAIRIVKNLIKEDRFATTEEQQALSKFVGWGGLANAFDNRKPEWTDEFAELKELLTEDEYKAAKASTLNAHYTSMDVIKAMYDGLRGMGFTGGRILEPSCGIGHFAGAKPADLNATSMTMVELDPITGNIAKYLYPNYDVRIDK